MPARLCKFRTYGIGTVNIAPSACLKQTVQRLQARTGRTSRFRASQAIRDRAPGAPPGSKSAVPARPVSSWGAEIPSTLGRATAVPNWEPMGALATLIHAPVGLLRSSKRCKFQGAGRGFAPTRSRGRSSSSGSMTGPALQRRPFCFPTGDRGRIRGVERIPRLFPILTMVVLIWALAQSTLTGFHEGRTDESWSSRSAILLPTRLIEALPDFSDKLLI